MTIAQMREASNRALSKVPKDVLLLLLVLSTSTASFGLGMLSEKQYFDERTEKGRGFWIEERASTTPAVLGAEAVGAVAGAVVAEKILSVSQTGTQVAPSAPAGKTPLVSGKYLASKNGTKYYLPNCSGAKRIKESNRVWFASVEDAKASGRTPASNCKGL